MTLFRCNLYKTTNLVDRTSPLAYTRSTKEFVIRFMAVENVAWPKRLVGVALFGLLFLWHAAAIAPLLTQATQTKSCCKRKESCCCKTKKSAVRSETGASWSGPRDCSRQCSLSALMNSRGGWLPMPVGAARASALPVEPAPRTLDLAGPASHSYLAFLYQRPPPSL